MTSPHPNSAPSSQKPKVILQGKALLPSRLTHPWVFRSDLKKIITDQAGIVEVKSPQGKRLGDALYSPQSQIALRWLTRGKEKWDQASLHQRLESAKELREKIYPKDKVYRLVFGESDGLPSLIIDRYEDVFVLQTLSAGMELLKTEIVHWLVETFKPLAIIERNDPSVRLKEGLAQSKGVLWGEEIHELEIKILQKKFILHPLTGQKTGFFLDQRFHAAQVAPLLKGKVLDAFSYSGQFAIHAADFADHIHCIDQSEEALSQVQKNAQLNHCENKITTTSANVFDALKELHQEKKEFDAALLDPPAFVKSRQSWETARRGYKEINLRAMKLLKPGGILVTSSCSQHLSRQAFLDLLAEAAWDAHRSAQILMELTQEADHPRLLSMPESEYLKSFALKIN